MIRLRPYKSCDAQYIVKWIKNEQEFRLWSADRYDKYPIDADKLNEHYDSYKDNDSFWPMTAFDENGVVGHLIMRFTDKNKMTIRFGFVIVDDSLRGKGYGHEMLHLAIKYAFEILKVNKITLGVFERNKTAIKCYKEVGFKEVLHEEKHYHMLNQDWNCIEMEIQGIQNKVYENLVQLCKNFQPNINM